VTPLAERLLAHLEAGRLTRVPQATLLELMLELEPALRTSPLKRERLTEAIAEGVAAGRLQLPADRRRDSGHPPLPAWVAVVREDAAPSTVAGHEYFWRPELAWASELRFRPDELERLKRVNAWLRDRAADEPVVPLRERSLELFGDEKLLERLLGGRLFFGGRLSLPLLRARPVHPPFVCRPVSEAPVLLVIENHHTFHSLSELLGPSNGVGVLAYGAGDAFVGSVTYAGDLGVGEIRYFGDLDAKGLRIPAAADRERGLGLPPVLPAVALYERLLSIGVPASAPAVPADVARELAAWLPADLRVPVVSLLEGGRRLAQEAVGYKVVRAWLREDPRALVRS
jgi:Uncharacterized protein conserved in bacteria C-term(DUF2220)